MMTNVLQNSILLSIRVFHSARVCHVRRRGVCSRANHSTTLYVPGRQPATELVAARRVRGRLRRRRAVHCRRELITRTELHAAQRTTCCSKNYMLLKLLISRTRDIFVKFLEYLKRTQMYIYTYLFRGQSYIHYCLLHLQNILNPT